MENACRCLGCGYLLNGLPTQRCPECGRDFDLQNPNTFSNKPLFVAWRYWLPVVLFALSTGGILFVLVLFTSENVGMA